MIIRCNENRCEIEFSKNEALSRVSDAKYFRVTIRKDYVSAFTDVYMPDPSGHSLIKFFYEVAENWKGFDGKKDWTSLDDNFKLVCTSDTLGHFAIKSTIRNNSGTLSMNTIHVESGQLDKIAAEVKGFFDYSSVE